MAASAFSLPPFQGSVLGTDGQFIPFALNIGNSSDSSSRILVYPSTLTYGTFALDPTVCQNTTLPNCSELRGYPYNVSTSNTFSRIGQGQYPVAMEVQYNWGTASGETGTYGTDNIRLNTSRGTVALSGSVVASIFSRNTGLGLFGLGINTDTFTLSNSGVATVNSTLQLLRSAGSIPSLSYSYTAGIANFKTASLVLGGYDANSFTPNKVNFPFDSADVVNYAKVTLQSIVTNSTAGNPTTLTRSAIQVNIDSTISALWLPQEMCDAFESAFGLSWDGGTQLYTMNSTALANNNRANPSVSFIIGKQTVNGETVNITLPWRALNQTFYDPNNLSVTYPYFPLRRATNVSQYVLGRTFLQSAVFTVDHERRNFSIAQVNDLSATGYSPMLQNIVSASSNGGPTVETAEPLPAGGGTNVGAIAGGVVAGLLVLAAILGILFWRRRRRQNQRREAVNIDSAEPHTPGPQPLPTFPSEKTATVMAEMPTPRPGAREDYFGAAVADRRGYHKQNRSGDSSELDGEQRAGAHSPAPAYRSINEHAVHDGPSIAAMTSQSLPAAELPGNLTAQELESRHVSSTSALPMQGTFFSPASSTMQSPISELAPSPGDDTLGASAGYMGRTSPNDAGVALTAQPVSLSPTRGAASILDINRNRAGSNSSPAGTGTNSHITGVMSATSGPMTEGLGVIFGDRPGASESLRRNDSAKSSKGSGSTLVHNDGSGSSTTTALQSAPRAPIQE